MHFGRSVLHVKSRHPRVGVDFPHGVVVGGLGVPPLLPYALLLYITELIYKCTTDFGP